MNIPGPEAQGGSSVGQGRVTIYVDKAVVFFVAGSSLDEEGGCGLSKESP